MKKLLSLLCTVLVFCVTFSPVGRAEGKNEDTLLNWNIKVSVPEGTS